MNIETKQAYEQLFSLCDVINSLKENYFISNYDKFTILAEGPMEQMKQRIEQIQKGKDD